MTDSTQASPALQEFAIDVIRTGYGVATINVKAADVYAAQELALDQAGNHLYNEKSSEYELSYPAPAPVNPHEMRVTFEMTSREGEDPVAGAQFVFKEATINRIERTASLLESEDLSEARYFTYPEQYFYKSHQESGVSLDSPEMVIAQRHISFEGCKIGSEYRMSSECLAIPVLLNAFKTGVKLLVVNAGYASFGPLEFMENTGQAIHNLDVGVSTMVVAPGGIMTAQEYAEYLDEEGEDDDASPVER